MLDHRLTSNWHAAITLPYNDELFLLEDTKVDESGNVYLLGLVYKEKNIEKRKDLPNYEYLILSYEASGNVKNEISIPVKDKFITHMKIVPKANREIICGGFYSEKGTMSIKGSFFCNVNISSKEIGPIKFREFTDDFFARFMTKEKITKEKELYGYDLDQLLLKQDGGAILVAQYSETWVTITTGSQSMTRTVNYKRNDIIVVSIKANGDIDWYQKIPKSQVTHNDYAQYSSYAFARKQDDIYFIFNDHPKNFTLEEGKILISFHGENSLSSVVLVKIDQSGKMKKKEILTSDDLKVNIRPVACEQLVHSQVLILGQNKNEYRMAKIAL